ncbi:MAG: DUF1015 domain-containing protein [Candidatus Omnitrophota bacterium]|jgi:uncharacterized protein (DUF1015 family)|nr:MAG: DUF1015 domain-containing protein [Candidatus Omnitrophota bacterium]
MTEIKPFRAIVYNQEVIKELSKVVCPPYDVISQAKQNYYHGLSPYNFIHILFGKDVPDEDKYRRAAELFQKWQKEKILVQEEKPCVYFYSQQYRIRGEKKTRFGLIAAMSLDEKRSSVYGHEHTRVEPKTDRLHLLRKVKANLSPIFVLFSDKKRVIQKCCDYVQDKEPFIEVGDDEKTVHRVWRIESDSLLEKIRQAMRTEDFFIADGHHRYEVARAYREEMLKKHEPQNQEGEFNYLLSYFTNVESHGLSILPIHRLITLSQKIEPQEMLQGLREYFHLEEIKDKARFFFLLQKAGNTEHVVGMYLAHTFHLLRLKNIKILDRLMLEKPVEYRRLDVSILNNIIFNQILSFSPEEKEKITYGIDPDEFIQTADEGKRNVAFFLNPVKVQQIIAVALKGEKMPPKSTYFYPKVLSGLLVHTLEE